MTNQVAEFYNLSMVVQAQEESKRHAQALLDETYPRLIAICPHSEAIQYQYPRNGWGPFRVCKICGIEDQSSEGGTPGDEYNYGYPGHPSKTFWGDSNVEITEDEDYFWSFRRGHGWTVKDGKPYKWGVTTWAI